MTATYAMRPPNHTASCRVKSEEEIWGKIRSVFIFREPYASASSFSSFGVINSSSQTTPCIAHNGVLPPANEVHELRTVFQGEFPGTGLESIQLSRAEKLILSLKGSINKPVRYCRSSEDAFCIVFANQSERLYFEIYSDGSMGYISEDLGRTRILRNEDVDSIEKMADIIKHL